MNEIRARVDAIVADPETAEALKPWYRQLCKRPCFHDEYLDAYNNPSTHLIDTDGKGVERIDETGVWADGEHYELDCLIYASGFEVGTEYARRAGFDAVGRDGEKLSEHWADGMQSLHGIHVHGFPNMFIVGPTQGANLISNIPHNLTEAGRTIAAIIDHASRSERPRSRSPPRPKQAWVERLRGRRRREVDELARLHARLLQQRGSIGGPARDAQLHGVPGGSGGVLPVHRRLAEQRRLRGPGVPSLTGRGDRCRHGRLLTTPPSPKMRRRVRQMHIPAHISESRSGASGEFGRAGPRSTAPLNPPSPKKPRSSAQRRRTSRQISGGWFRVGGFGVSWVRWASCRG